MKGSRLLAATVAASLLPTLALAQPAEPAAEPAKAETVPVKAPAKAVAPASAAKKPVDPSLAVHARAFFLALTRGDADSLTLLCKLPFHFEGRVANTPDELKQGWAAALSGKSLENARLFDIELLTADEMTEKYGRPPERLASWPLKGGMLSIANLDGHPVIVLWKKSGQSWQALGLHD